MRIPRLVLILISLAALIYISERLWQLFRLFADLARMLALAGLLAYILHPVVAWMDRGLFPEAWLEHLIQRGAPPALRRLARLRIPYALGATLIYTGLLGLLLLALLLGLPLLIRQALDLAALLPQRLQHLPEEMVRVQRELAMRLNIPPEALALLPSREAWQDLARQGAGWLFPVLVETARQVGGGVVEFLLILALSYYTMLDWHNISQQVLSLIPRHYHDEIHTTARILDRTFGGFLRGQLLIALLNGLVTLLVMLAFEAPFAGLIALLSALIILIPIIGAPIALWGPPLTLWLQGAWTAGLWMWLILLVYQQVLFHFLVPRMLGEATGLPPLLTLIAVLIGVRLFGFWGFVFAIPIAGAGYSLAFLLLRPREDAIRARERSAGSPSTDPIEDRK
ncbi:MAG: AI-2E family transporter [Thermoflexus sp.]|nr:AI-2E family transporter [Thermoflexus sp.]MDT7883686.1 AI-2E family transporter [Thermoflexus sp.]MDT7947138.1 AI-2E family transporter [Thermoflexus sp.]